MNIKRTLITAVIIIIFIGLVLVLPNHIPGIGIYTDSKPAGFLAGIWHGWVAPINLFMSIFDSRITIFESTNSGWWYQCGYYLAIIGGFGGLTFSRSRYNYVSAEPNKVEKQGDKE